MGRAAVMLFLGVTMTRLLWTGAFGFFIQQRMRIPLLLATIVLLVMGAAEAFAASREETRDPDSTFKMTGPKVGWLMILPLLVLVSVAPTGLGAAATERVEPFTPVETESNFEPLDTSVQPLELRVFDFVDRAVWDTEESLSDVTVRLEGLVVNDPNISDGFRLTRFLVSCCAADGVPIQVVVHGLENSYPDDTWVEADVVWREPDIDLRQALPRERIVEADVVSISVVPDPPTDAYESPY